MRFNENQEDTGLLSRLLTYSLAGCLLFSLVSITLMESFLALSFVFWIVLIIKGRKKFAAPGFFWPLLAYAGLSLVACLFSVNPEISFKDARELLLYLIIPIVMTAGAAERGIPTLLAWLAFITWAFVSLFPMLKNRDPSVFPHTTAAAAALLACSPRVCSNTISPILRSPFSSSISSRCHLPVGRS
jgi:hypothetical protein